MNKRTFTLLIAALFILKASAQQVLEEQRTLITKRTATWCPNCGTWGWTLMQGLIEDNQDKAVIIAAHESGILETAAAADITDNWGAFSQPRFFVNETDFGVTPSQIQTARTDIKAFVDQAFTHGPVANAGFNWNFANNTLKVDARVRFFQETQGDFYLGLYLLENNVMEIQSGQSGLANHQKVLRFCLTQDSWGKPVTNGTVAAGTDFDLDYELSISSIDGYDYELAAIVWNKVNDVYIPVNAWSSDLTSPTAVKENTGLSAFEVFPSVSSGHATVTLELERNQQMSVIDLLDNQGRIVTNLHKGPLSAGNHTFPLQQSAFLSKGLYFIRYADGNGIASRKLIFQ